MAKFGNHSEHICGILVRALSVHAPALVGVSISTSTSVVVDYLVVTVPVHACHHEVNHRMQCHVNIIHYSLII